MRALYVCQSLNTTFQRFLRKKNFFLIIALVPQLLLTIHILNNIKYMLQHDDHPFQLYQACMNPFSFHDIPLTELPILDNFLIFIYDLIIVLGNLYMWKFLNLQTENNRSLREVDKKKERKKNFVPGINSIITSAAVMFSYIYLAISYNLKVCSKYFKLLHLKKKYPRKPLIVVQKLYWTIFTWTCGCVWSFQCWLSWEMRTSWENFTNSKIHLSIQTLN